MLQSRAAGWSLSRRDFLRVTSVAVAGIFAASGCGGGGDSGGGSSPSSTTDTLTLPCGSPIPAGYTCTCNCVSAGGSSGGNSQTDTITQPCGSPIPSGYTCTCNCVSRGTERSAELVQGVTRDASPPVAVLKRS